MATRSRGRRARARSRAPLRKFVWARSFGFLGSDSGQLGVDLLGNFQQEYGAQLVGATVVRIRGFVIPGQAPGLEGTYGGVYAIMVDSDNTILTDSRNAVEQREHEDWLAYLPYTIQGIDLRPGEVATSNAQGNPWAVDIKSSRKVQELGQSLFLFRETPLSADSPGMEWHLSIGLKLP